MAMIGIVWIDGLPAVGMEYGPGHAPLCCPQCGTCTTLIIAAQRGDTDLGWLLDPCRCILVSDLWAMNVTGTPDEVTVTFEPVPAQETGARSEAETEAAGADDVRAPRRRVRKTESSGRAQAHRPAGKAAAEEDEAS